MDLPFLTKDVPGIGGVIKQRDEDFFVQEIPLYEPSGEGEHVYCEVQKVGLTTFDAVHRIGKTLDRSVRDIGYAGLKDAKAITRQIFSIPLVTPEAVMALKIPDMTVLWAARHLNKLRLGHSKGNRFAIKIRNVNPTDVVKLRPMIDVIERRGMPNYFGEQRFGRRGNNDLLGAALVAGDNVRLLQLLLGAPDAAIDDSQTLGARGAFDRRDNETAMRLYPRSHGMERRILARLMKTHKPNAAVRGIDQKLRRLWVSALQSRVFNQTLSTRLEAETMDRVIDGDLAMKHENGACFSVEDVAVEQPRVDAFEISPTGPMVGYRMTLPKGEALRLEQEVFDEVGVTPESFRNSNERAKGERRALRVKPTDIELNGGVDEHGGYITVAFSLPSGSYATMFLRELMKSDESAGRSNEDTATQPSEESV
ncbi:MAG: tRNA pseudouridine(13) synthase TruD [Anaerolineae bacterium]|nr:tRNA pseudouridine(13) synthase TruD [Phycisphaerae bacterium]